MNVRINSSGNIELQNNPGEEWIELSSIEPDISVTTSTSSNVTSWWPQYSSTNTASWTESIPVYYYPDPVYIKEEEPVEEVKLAKLDISIEDLL